MKTCFRCGCQLPLSCFYRHPRMADGHLGKCKECTKFDVTNNRMRKLDYYRSWDKARNADSKRRWMRRLYSRNHAAANPDRKKARTATNNAIRDRKLIRRPCEVCGSHDVEAHHEDYSMPLAVRWLCFVHHRIEHGQFKDKQ